MSSIPTVAKLGQDYLVTTCKINYLLASRMLGLANKGIHFSLGIAMQMSKRSKECTLLKKLVESPGIENLLANLANENIPQEIQTRLDRTLNQIIESDSKHSTRLRQQSVPDFDPLGRKLAALGLRLELKAVIEEKAVVIALKDEQAATSMALTVAHSRGGDVELPGKEGEGFFTGLSPAQKEDLSARVMDRLAEKFFLLPSVTMDPEKLKGSLNELAPFITTPADRMRFAKAATHNYFDCPPASRALIAAALKSSILKREIMECIEILCGSAAEASRAEAVNTLVAYIIREPARIISGQGTHAIMIRSEADQEQAVAAECQSMLAEVERKMAAVSLLKVLQEEQSERVVNRALTRMAELSEKVQAKIPVTLEGVNLLLILKQILLRAPRAYRVNAEKLLTACGRENSQAVKDMLTDDLEIVEDPYVRYAYGNVLEALGERLAEMRKLRWDLYFAVRQSHPDLEKEIIAQFKKGGSSSVSHLKDEFNAYSMPQQIHFIEILDGLLVEALPFARENEDARKTCSWIATLFYQKLQEKGASADLQKTILRTRTVVLPLLPQRLQSDFWPAIVKYFPELMREDAFLAGFIACGQNYLIDLTGQIVVMPHSPAAWEYLGISARKAQTIDLGRLSEEELAKLKDALDLLLAETLPYLEASIPGIEARDVFQRIASFAASPAAGSEAVVKIFGEVKKASANKKELFPLFLDVAAELASQPKLSPEIFEVLLNQFQETLKIQLSIVNRIEAADAARRKAEKEAQDEARQAAEKKGKEYVPQVNVEVNTKRADALNWAEQLLDIAFTGLTNICANPQMQGQLDRQESIVKMLIQQISRRPKRFGAYVKGSPREVLPDPLREKLIDTARSIQMSPYFDPSVKRALADGLSQLD